jgi:cleavage stimulation factor subunit 2
LSTQTPSRDRFTPNKERSFSKPQSENSVFLGNLAWDVTKEIVEDMLNDIVGPGSFTRVRLAVDRETGRPRGFGHIDFKDSETAERAIVELNGMEVMGRQIRADNAQRGEK